MSSICSQGSADSVSDSSEPGCEPSPSVRSNLSPVPSSPSIGRTSPAITTSMTLQQTDWIGMESVESTSSAAATLASPFPTPGSKEATKIRVTSGRKCAELLAKSDPLGYLLKMLLVTSRWGSTRCLLTWKPMATQRGRLLFRLVPKTPPTSGSESGSWLAEEAARFYPTMDYGAAKGRGQSSADDRSRLGGSLNPEWVEWLMGFPDGWTDLGPSETPSSRKSSKKSGGRSWHVRRDAHDRLARPQGTARRAPAHGRGTAARVAGQQEWPPRPGRGG